MNIGFVKRIVIKVKRNTLALVLHYRFNWFCEGAVAVGENEMHQIEALN